MRHNRHIEKNKQPQTGIKIMTYTELKTELKALQSAGHAIPALNSKKAILENALAQILASIEPTAPSTVTDYDTTPSVEITPPEPAPITTPEVTPVYITPENPAVTELREIAKGIETALIWAITVIRSMIRFSAPYVKKALQVALRVTIYTSVLLLPKIQLVAYSLGIWGLTIALRLIHSRRLVIA